MPSHKANYHVWAISLIYFITFSQNRFKQDRKCPQNQTQSGQVRYHGSACLVCVAEKVVLRQVFLRVSLPPGK
jgi:hypothetical protein